MIEWKARKVVNEDVQFPYRYNLIDPSTGQSAGIFDIERVETPGNIDPTIPDEYWLQPIEDFLEAIGLDLKKIDQEVANTNTKLSTSESNVNARIVSTQTDFNTQIGNSDRGIAAVDGRVTAANTRIDGIDTTMGTLAPLNNPVLTNPTANTISISTNNTSLATTAAVKTYLDNLMASYKG